MQVDMKCREYEYVYAGKKSQLLKMGVESKSTNLETDEIGTEHAIKEFLSAWGCEGLGKLSASEMTKNVRQSGKITKACFFFF
jgi:hypothetical protein